MKRTFSISIFKTFVICLLALGTVSGQNKKQTENTLFGKQIKPENANPKNGFIRCASTEYEKFLQEKNPKRMTETQFEAWAAPLVQKHITMRTSQINAVITIPVVVHVIHSGQAVGSAPNITDAQVQSQITVLNQDYSKMAGTPGYNTNPIGVDTQIQFVLAQQDPNGNPTNGIDRRSFCQESWSNTDIESTLKPATIWDPTQYLNLWSVQLTDSTLLGYAQFPDASGLSGLNGSGTANTDGVVVKYNAFGSGFGSSFLLEAPYNKGRTMTHEIGHWLGLIHIWGDGSNCATNTDYCADTPVTKEANYGCVSGTDSCPSKPGLDMIENYMEYTDDACMNIFTQNQKDRMDVIMNNAPRRSSLKTSIKGVAVPLFANDAEVKLESSCTVATCSSVPNQTIQNITIYNRGTNTLTSAMLNYTINSGSNMLYSWAGSLATNKFATFPITINSASNGSITISIDKANGVTDQRGTNNSVSGNFVIPVAPPNYTFTNYTFRLQQDYFGSETTWSIKNAAGTILYKGGPYTDTFVNETTISPIPALITQNWTLPSNQCYTFTINDAAGDGICCGSNLGDSGTGYYDLKSTDGLTVVTSGASFTSSESKSFTTNTILDTTKPTLTTVADRDENVDAKCEFAISDYTLFTTVADNSGTVTVTQSPSQGTIISGYGTVQLITLTALDSNGNSDFITFKITLRENDIYLYPSPSKETINIITSQCVLPNSFSIYNSVGQMISQKEVKTAIDLTVNTSFLSSGIYFITVVKGDDKKTLQFIKK